MNKKCVRIYRIVLICIIWGLMCFNPAFAKEKMIWLQQDAKPYFISSGKYKGQGLFELIQKIIQKNLPEYDHENVTLPQKRLFNEFESNRKVCAVGVIKNPERQKYMYFTAPTFFLVPHRITIRKEDWGLFQNRKEISLDKLLGDTSLTLGITAGRSYGTVIDSILNKHKGQQNIHFRYGSLYEDLFEMLLLGRIDYIIGYPTETIYSMKTFEAEDKVMNLVIEENKDYILGFAGLPRNEWGKDMVKRLNAILLKERGTDEYRKSLESWQGIEPNNISYQEDYDEIFLKTIQ